MSGAFELVGIEGLAILIQEFEKHFAPDQRCTAESLLIWSTALAADCCRI